MGFISFMMKNGPGSPGSICKDFGKVYLQEKQRFPNADNVRLFTAILNARYPRMSPAKAATLASCTNGDFMLYIFMITLYQNKGTLSTGHDQWGIVLDAIYDTAMEKFPQLVKMPRHTFKDACKYAFACMEFYL